MDSLEDIANAAETAGDTIVLLAGDLILDVEDPDYWLSGIAPAVRAAHLSIGHLEVPHTRRGREAEGDVPAPPAPPENLDALRTAGFDAVTLAGNHISDRGAEGIADTIAGLDGLGIAHTGAGRTLELARQAAWLEHAGRSVAILSYNCVGPETGWAGPASAGCNYLPLLTADGSAVSPAAPLTDVPAESIDRLRADIAEVGADADLVVVALHKGIVHTPAALAPYERPLTSAAIAAGADIVVGHHAHILRGIEIDSGRPVFHGLGNGCVVTRALSPAQDHAARAAWARSRRELFGFEPDPRYTLAPFHPDAVHGLLGIVIWRRSGRLDCGVVPVYVEPPGRPVCVTDRRADAVIDYLRQIGEFAGLPEQRWQRRSPSLWLSA